MKVFNLIERVWVTRTFKFQDKYGDNYIGKPVCEGDLVIGYYKDKDSAVKKMESMGYKIAVEYFDGYELNHSYNILNSIDEQSDLSVRRSMDIKEIEIEEMK